MQPQRSRGHGENLLHHREYW